MTRLRVGERIALFNPRQQVWIEHFAWSEDGTEIIGKTACGRAIVAALGMNNVEIVVARRSWVSVGWWPPKFLALCLTHVIRFSRMHQSAAKALAVLDGVTGAGNLPGMGPLSGHGDRRTDNRALKSACTSPLWL